MKPSYDVIIVGAGPSGAVAAYSLARAGKRVALIDRATFPRPKVCGDCLNPQILALWRRLELADRFHALPHQEVRGLVLELDGHECFRQTFRSGHPGPRAVAREVLDQWLVDEAIAAGAEFFPGTTVTALNSAAGEIETTQGAFSAALILGADGRNSQIARQAGLAAATKRCRRIAWQTTLPAPATLDDHVHMHIFPEGYYGMTRINDRQANLCFVLHGVEEGALQTALPIAQRYFPGMDAATEWRRVNPITRGPAQLTSDKLWLLGDAARVVEPFTGEGIYFALASGELAAQSWLTASTPEQAAAAYRQAHRRLYARREWVNIFVRIFLGRPGWAEQGLRLLQHTPGILAFLNNRVHASA